MKTLATILAWGAFAWFVVACMAALAAGAIVRRAQRYFDAFERDHGGQGLNATTHDGDLADG